MISHSCKNLVMMCVLVASTIAIVLSTGGVSAASFGSCSPWTAVSSPNPTPIDNVLAAVTALSPTDMWAVGFNDRGTLTEHWNVHTWSTIPSPSFASGGVLSGVAALSPDTVWAVGNFSDSQNVPNTLTLQWNGTSWSMVASPSPFVGGNYLNAVAVVPGTQSLWSVGYGIDQQNDFRTLTESYCV